MVLSDPLLYNNNINGDYRSINLGTIDAITDVKGLHEAVVLNEVYFGEKAIMPMQKYFSKFRDKYVGKDWNPKINQDADLVRFNRAVEDAFGYNRFCLSISPTFIYNACMYDVGMLADDDIEKRIEENLVVKKSGSGFAFNREAGVNGMAVMNMGLLSDKGFTNRELVAIILHEIGHNFTKVVLTKRTGNSKGAAMIAATKAVNRKIEENLSTTRDLSDAKIDSDIQSIGLLDKLRSFIGNIHQKIKLSNIVHYVSNTVAGMKKNMQYYDYTNEKFADSFASMYGYGADLSSGLQKMENFQIEWIKNNRNVKTPSSINIAMEVMSLTVNGLLSFWLGSLDEHPNNLARFKTQIEYIEKELRNESLDPAMKQQLQSQLEQLKKLVNEYIENTENNVDFYTATRKYYVKLYKKYGGDYREKKTDNQAIFDKIDQTYEAIKNESAKEIIPDNISMYDLF